MLEQMRPAEVKILAKLAFGKAAALDAVTCNARTLSGVIRRRELRSGAWLAAREKELKQAEAKGLISEIEAIGTKAAGFRLDIGDIRAFDEFASEVRKTLQDWAGIGLITL
jgi:hypothetical protein